MSRTEQDTRTGKPPLFARTTGVKKSLPPTFLFKKFADEGDSSCNVGEDMSRTEQDTRTGKPPLFARTTGVKKSLPPTFLFKKFADEGTRTPMSFLART